MNKIVAITIATFLSIAIAFTLAMYFHARRQVISKKEAQRGVHLDKDALKFKSFHLSLSHIFWFEFSTYDVSGHETGSYFYWRLFPLGQIDVSV